MGRQFLGYGNGRVRLRVAKRLTTYYIVEQKSLFLGAAEQQESKGTQYKTVMQRKEEKK
jgi:hypothetical protein